MPYTEAEREELRTILCSASPPEGDLLQGSRLAAEHPIGSLNVALAMFMRGHWPVARFVDYLRGETVPEVQMPMLWMAYALAPSWQPGPELRWTEGHQDVDLRLTGLTLRVLKGQKDAVPAWLAAYGLCSLDCPALSSVFRSPPVDGRRLRLPGHVFVAALRARPERIDALQEWLPNDADALESDWLALMGELPERSRELLIHILVERDYSGTEVLLQLHVMQYLVDLEAIVRTCPAEDDYELHEQVGATAWAILNRMREGLEYHPGKQCMHCAELLQEISRLGPCPSAWVAALVNSAVPYRYEGDPTADLRAWVGRFGPPNRAQWRSLAAVWRLDQQEPALRDAREARGVFLLDLVDAWPQGDWANFFDWMNRTQRAASMAVLVPRMVEAVAGLPEGILGEDPGDGIDVPTPSDQQLEVLQDLMLLIEHVLAERTPEAIALFEALAEHDSIRMRLIALQGYRTYGDERAEALAWRLRRIDHPDIEAWIDSAAARTLSDS